MRKNLRKTLLTLLAVTAMAVIFCFGASAIKVGDVITLGSYKGKNMKWICVDIDNNGPLMLAKDVLCTKEYDAAGKSDIYHIDGWGHIREAYGSNCWYDSNIRQWLNSKEKRVSWTHCPPSYYKEPGFLTNFTSNEKLCIKSANRIVNVNGYETRRNGYCDGGTSGHVFSGLTETNFSPYAYYYKNIEDDVFLLNAVQYNSIYNSNPKFLKASAQYWTCAIPDTTNSFENVVSVYADGVSLFGATKAYFKSGVRPAFYLNTKVYNAIAMKPKTIKVTRTTTTATLKWDKVAGATGYKIYRKTSSGWKTLDTITATSCKIKGLKPGTSYTFAVKAYTKIKGKVIWAKKYTSVTVTAKLATPTLKVTSTKTKANLSWADIKGETGYAIYMATSKNGKYTHLANYKANSTKATKSKLKSGKTYYFKIRAYKKASGKTTYSAYSAVKSVKIK